MSRFAFVALLAFMSIAAATPSRANLLTNGSFEDPDLAENTFRAYRPGTNIGTSTPDGRAWTYIYHDAGPFVDGFTFVITDGYNYGGNTTPFGDQYYLLSQGESRTTSTTQGVGGMAMGRYELSFWQRPGQVTLDFRVGPNLLTFASILPGGAHLFAVGAVDGWVRQSIQFDVTSPIGNYYLVLYSVPGAVGMVDNFALDFAPTTAGVPVPASGALMMVGLLGFAGRRRKTVNSFIADEVRRM